MYECSRIYIADSNYVRLLQQYGNARAFSSGKQLHSQLIKSGIDRDTFIGNLIIRMYNMCGSLEDARVAFKRIRRPDVVSWNSILAACVKSGDLDEAREVFDSIPEKTVVSWNAMIAAYAHSGHMRTASELFESAPQRDAASWNAILTGYARIGLLNDAELTFEKMPGRNVVSWNAMIAAYDQNGYHFEALELFRGMDVKPNDVTFVTVLEACVNLGSLLDPRLRARGLSEGRHIFARATSTGLVSEVKVGNALINMFSKCGSLSEAKAVFDSMPRRNVRTSTIMIFAFGSHGFLGEARQVFNRMSERSLMSWNALISVYAQGGQPKEALHTFTLMKRERISPDRVTFIGLLEACSCLGDEDQCRRIHSEVTGLGLETELHVGNALVNTYGKCGRVSEAREVFDRMVSRNVVTWTCMVSVYAQNGLASQAFQVFQLMELEGVTPNPVTFANVVDACGHLVSFEKSRLVESEAVHLGFASELFVGSALVSMHGKCGDLHRAWNAFNRIRLKNLVSWTAIIAALAENGLGSSALDIFRVMELEGHQPDHVSFMGVLSACKNSGQLPAGVEFFRCMTGDYELAPAPGHFMCMVDLLGRSGRLELAEELIRHMPFEPQVWTWSSLLGACRAHEDGERGARAAQRALRLDPGRSSVYVNLSNICDIYSRERTFTEYSFI